MTVQKKDESGTTISDAGVTASASGRSLTASAGSTNYVFKTWKYGTAAGTSIASETSASTSLTGTPSGAVTVIAEFYKPCTVTWKVNGTTLSTTTVARGSTATLPSAPNPASYCGDKFMGWTTVQNHDAATVPSPLITSAPTITGDVTYYAVFGYYEE